MARQVRVIFTRKKALQIGWYLFWMATGTRRVGMVIDEDGNIELLGESLIEKEVGTTAHDGNRHQSWCMINKGCNCR